MTTLCILYRHFFGAILINNWMSSLDSVYYYLLSWLTLGSGISRIGNINSFLSDTNSSRSTCCLYYLSWNWLLLNWCLWGAWNRNKYLMSRCSRHNLINLPAATRWRSWSVLADRLTDICCILVYYCRGRPPCCCLHLLRCSIDRSLSHIHWALVRLYKNGRRCGDRLILLGLTWNWIATWEHNSWVPSHLPCICAWLLIGSRYTYGLKMRLRMSWSCWLDIPA